MKISRLFAVLLAAPLLFMFVNAQDDAQAADADGAEKDENVNKWQPEFLQEGRRISIADYNIENPTALNTSPLLKNANRPRMWRFFMNGISDAKGYPVPWQALGIEDSALDADTVIDLSHKKSNLPSLMLKGGESLSPTTPVIAPEMIYSMRGQTLRFFVWIMAQDTGNGVDLWHGAPKVKLTLFDGSGNLSSSVGSVFKTRGTYPWFCYHIDMQIPYDYTIPAPAQAEAGAENEAGAAENNAEEGDNAAKGENAQNDDDASIDNIFSDMDSDEDTMAKNSGLFITIANPVSGKAWFSTLSWSRIKQNDYMLNPTSREVWLDPQTGSYAPNPDYDELPMHFIFGLSKNSKWNYLHGTKAIPDMTRKANLEKFLANVEKDWLAMQYALPYLISVFNNGNLFKTIDGFEEGWETTLADAIQKLQDSQTGFWCVNGVPNLFVTEQILTNCFAKQPPVRKDWTPAEEPWKGLEGLELNHSDAIISTIVDNAKPAKKGAAWNNCIFQTLLKDTPEGQADCDITATSAAATILRYAIPHASKDKAEQAEEILKHAWDFTTEYMILVNGLWKNSSRDSGVTTPGFMFKFLDATDWMTFRPGEDMLPVQVKTKLSTSGQMTLSWTPEPPFVALRVFAAPLDVSIDKLNESNLFAIIQPKSTSLSGMDPILGLRFLANAAKKTWGITPRSNGANYLATKLARTPQKLQVFDKTQNLKFKIPADKRKLNVHVAAVTAYGEMSPVFTLPEKIIPTGADEEETEASEASEN